MEDLLFNYLVLTHHYRELFFRRYSKLASVTIPPRNETVLTEYLDDIRQKVEELEQHKTGVDIVKWDSELKISQGDTLCEISTTFEAVDHDTGRRYYTMEHFLRDFHIDVDKNAKYTITRITHDYEIM